MESFAAGIERIGNLLDEKDLENLMRDRKIIKVGLVPIITKGCSDEKKWKIKLKLFEIVKGFEDEFAFEFLVWEKKPDKQFEYLEKVNWIFNLIFKFDL